jgi:hypothetical protein
MTKILQVLNNRVTYITVIFGLFGGALSLLLKVEEMKNFYPALSTLIALLVSLLVSLLIKGKRDKRSKDRLKISAVLLFLLFLVCAAFHTRYVINQTFEYHEFDKVNRYVKGEYSDSGLAAKKKYPMLNDEQILYQIMGGTDGIENYWTRTSIDNNILWLILTYCGLVMFFVACITLLTEILAEKDKPKRKPRKKVVPKPRLPHQVEPDNDEPKNK